MTDCALYQQCSKDKRSSFSMGKLKAATTAATKKTSLKSITLFHFCSRLFQPRNQIGRSGF